MKKAFFILLLTFLLAVSMLFADDVEVNLDGNTSAHVFSVKDNAAATLMKVTGDGNVAITGSSKYLNFNSTQGATGYGFRDNAGTLEYKNSGGSWTPWTTPVTSPYGFPSSAYSYGQIAWNHGNYSDTQPTTQVGNTSNTYYPLLPGTLGAGGGTPWITIANGDISVATIGGLPAYLKINAAGTYKITASIAIKGGGNQAVEVEVFRQNSGTVPAIGSWITNPTPGYHDIESMSSVFETTTGKYVSSSVTGVLDCVANDYIAFLGRNLVGASQTCPIYCINLTAERIK
jgi:hypothetical protein